MDVSGDFDIVINLSSASNAIIPMSSELLEKLAPVHKDGCTGTDEVPVDPRTVESWKVFPAPAGQPEASTYAVSQNCIRCAILCMDRDGLMVGYAFTRQS